MKKLFIILGLFALAYACSENGDKEPPTLVDNHFMAIPMPGTLVTGNPYPTDSTLINSWVANSNSVNNLETNSDIIDHGWAIWSALNEVTDQVNNGQNLRRFETWYTPQDIKDAYNLRKANPEAKLSHVKRTNGNFIKQRQVHQGKFPPDPEDPGVVGFVKYDPSLAEHIYQNDLFYQSKLESMLRPGEIANIPNVPNSGVALKPVFTALTDKVKDSRGYYKVPLWHGDEGNPNRPFGSNVWGTYVYITLGNDVSEADTVYSINDFIHFKMDADQAAPFKAKAGDYAVLEGMHVTTREITRWTWQTYWWSLNNDSPYSPSSETIAGQRNGKGLDRASGHYAMAIAYNTVQPAQPYNGGSGRNATSLYAYNPYLEASFDTNTFSVANDTVRQYYPVSYQEVGGMLNEYGMQTNCMSCHGQARYVPAIAPPKEPDSTGLWQLYLTDQYFELDAPYFRNTVKLDFTWSIRGNLIPEGSE